MAMERLKMKSMFEKSMHYLAESGKKPYIVKHQLHHAYTTIIIVIRRSSSISVGFRQFNQGRRSRRDAI